MVAVLRKADAKCVSNVVILSRLSSAHSTMICEERAKGACLGISKHPPPTSQWFPQHPIHSPLLISERFPFLSLFILRKHKVRLWHVVIYLGYHSEGQPVESWVSPDTMWGPGRQPWQQAPFPAKPWTCGSQFLLTLDQWFPRIPRSPKP